VSAALGSGFVPSDDADGADGADDAAAIAAGFS
jgi:hypothetical protein